MNGKRRTGESFQIEKFGGSNQRENRNYDLLDKEGNVLPGFSNLEPDEYNSIISGLSTAGVATTAFRKDKILGISCVGGSCFLLEGLAFATAVLTFVQLFGSLAGLESELTNALSIAAFAGIMTFKGLQSLGPEGFRAFANPENFLVKRAGLIGLGVGIAIFILLYKKESQQVVNFQCLPWEPITGGGKLWRM